MNDILNPVESLRRRQRDLWVVSSLVILALAVGVVMLWPKVEALASRHLGQWFPRGVLLGELLLLVGLLIVYTARKGRQLHELVLHIVEEIRQKEQLSDRLTQTRSVLEVSSRVDLGRGATESLQRVVRGMGDCLRSDRVALYCARDKNALQRAAQHATSKAAADSPDAEYEDALASLGQRSGKTLVVDDTSDLKSLGVFVPRPSAAKVSLVIPLGIESGIVGAAVVRNPFDGEALDDSAADMIAVISGFAAAVVKNLYTFQRVSDRFHELERNHRLLTSHQRDITEMETVNTLNRVAHGLLHAISGPLTAIDLYSGMLSKTITSETQEARDGIRQEIAELRDKIQGLIQFTQDYRARFELLDLGESLNIALALRGQSLSAHGIQVKFKAHPNLPLTMVDPLRIRQLFLSVLEFAEDTLLKEPEPRELTVKLYPSSGFLRIVFAFRASEEVNSILLAVLNPNTEFDAAQQNHGLGLCVATNIARMHQGNVTTDSSAGALSLTVEIPIRRDPPPLNARHGADARSAGSPAGTGNALEVIDRLIRAESSLPRVRSSFGPVEPLQSSRPAPPSHSSVQKLRPRSSLPSDFDRVFAAATEPQPPPSALPSSPRIGVQTPVHPEPDLRPVGDRPLPPGQLAKELPAAPHYSMYQERPTVDANRPGLEQVFPPEEVWSGDEKGQDKNPPSGKRPSVTAPLLDRGAVENALKLFDL